MKALQRLDRTIRMTRDRFTAEVAARATGTPITEELIVLLRARVETRYYDRPDVVDAVARAVAARAGAGG